MTGVLRTGLDVPAVRARFSPLREFAFFDATWHPETGYIRIRQHQRKR